MASSYISSNIHYVFSTKHRKKLIPDDLKPRLSSYMGGIARENNMKALAIGGTQDHMHLLISLPATITIAKAIQLVKAGSSKWLHDTFEDLASFGWQVGYGAFSVSHSNVAMVKEYIQRQEEHHRERTFQEEFLALLQRHDIAYDERYLWE